MSAALMVSVGANFLTKVGNGPTLALMFSAGGNIFTHIGNGLSAALIPPYMATLILPLPFLVTIFRPPNKEPLTLPVEESVKTLAPVDVEVSKGNLSLTGIGAANIINYKAQGILNANLAGGANKINKEGSGNSIITCVCNLINETYPCKRNIAIGRMINNITTATTSKISITILSCINNMISWRVLAIQFCIS
jgi:hypothetical protein